VTFLDGHEVVDPIAVDGVVRGVRIINRINGMASTLDADLVVDAMGRAARTPVFLEGLGCGRPAQLRVATALGYSTQRLSIPRGCIDRRVVKIDQGPTKPGVILLASEHDTWMMAVGRSMDEGGAPPDFATMLAVAAEVLPSAIADGLRRAEPIGEIATFRNPAAVWRRYDRMPRFPAGLLVIGDGLCSLNPVYGQGMTMAALEALALRDCLHFGETDLAQRFFAAAASVIGPTWARNEDNDRVKSPSRKRAMRQRLSGHAVSAYMTAAAYDIRVAELLVRVSQLIDPPSRLNDPALLPRVLAANLRHIVGRMPNPVSAASRWRPRSGLIENRPGVAHA
jgi:hypothetical protein